MQLVIWSIVSDFDIHMLPYLVICKTGIKTVFRTKG